MPRLMYASVAPDAIRALMGVKAYEDGSTIEGRLRALVELRVSQINGCVFCLDMHAREARHAGETTQRLDCLAGWREAPFYSEREKAALAWAEAVTLVSETGVPDDVYELASSQLSEKELVDLTVVVGMINLWNRLSVSFRSVPPTRRGEAGGG